MIRNRKNLIMDRDCEDLIRVERGTSDRGEKKKRRNTKYLSKYRDCAELSWGIPIPILVPREAKERARPHVRNDAAFAPSQTLPPLPSSSQSYLALSLSVFPPDWSASPVIHRKHRMQTVTWIVGTKVPRGRARRMRERKVKGYVYVHVCCGAKRFTALYSCRSWLRYAKGPTRRFRYFDIGYSLIEYSDWTIKKNGIKFSWKIKLKIERKNLVMRN